MRRIACRRVVAWLLAFAVGAGTTRSHAQEEKQQWAYFLGGFASGSPALSADGETIYIGVEQSSFGRVLAIPKDGGAARWNATLPDSVSSSPAISETAQTVYIGCEDGKLYALNSQTGRTRWTVDTGANSFVSGSPAIGANGTVYFGAGDFQLYAVSSSGQKLWTFPTLDWITSSPAIGLDGTIYVGSNDGNLYAVDPAGREKWRFATGGEVESSPAIGADGTIYVGSRSQKVFALTSAGVKKWEQTTNDEIVASPVIGADGTIYVASFDRNFYALNPDTGQRKWTMDYGVTSQSTAAVRADGVIIFGADDGIVRALEPSNGALRWKYDTKKTRPDDFIESSPVVAPDGSIYFGSLDGHLYKLAGNGSPLSTYSPWPAFHRDIRHTGQAVAKASGGQLVNISSRAMVGGGRYLIAGFVVQASIGRAYLIQAVGPGLGTSTTPVNGFMPDPRLDLYSGQVVIRSNDNWLENDEQFGSSLSEAAKRVGAFPLSPGSADAAILPLLQAGALHAVVTSADGRPGVALIEVYDVPSTNDPAARLLNLSTRGFVGTGENILIAGFVVRDGPIRLLLRGIGPGLAQFNVGGVLAQPKLTVFSGSTPVASNTGWTADGYRNDIIAAGASASAFPLSENQTDSALLFEVKQPGPYTIQISGVGNTTGEALVEIYVLP